MPDHEDMVKEALLYLYGRYQKNKNVKVPYRNLNEYLIDQSGCFSDIEAALKTLKYNKWIENQSGLCWLTFEGIEQAKKIKGDGTSIYVLIVLAAIIAIVGSKTSEKPSSELPTPAKQSCQIIEDEAVILTNTIIEDSEGNYDEPGQEICGYLKFGDKIWVIGEPSRKYNLTWREIRMPDSQGRCKKGWVAEYRPNGQPIFKCP